MFTSKIVPSASFAGSFDLHVLHNDEPFVTVPCHNYASAETYARLLTQPWVHADEVPAEDRSGLIAEIIPGRFYGAYTVLVFDENNLLCNAIDCANIGTARHYKQYPTRRSL